MAMSAPAAEDGSQAPLPQAVLIVKDTGCGMDPTLTDQPLERRHRWVM